MSLNVYLSRTACDACDACGRQESDDFTANITHNLGAMAKAAGIYKACWRPEEIGITKAEQLIEPLAKGLAWLKEHPEEAVKYDAPNGWGVYGDFVPWVEAYLDACKSFPKDNVKVWR